VSVPRSWCPGLGAPVSARPKLGNAAKLGRTKPSGPLTEENNARKIPPIPSQPSESR
jgi:hypothetical protein